MNLKAFANTSGLLSKLESITSIQKAGQITLKNWQEILSAMRMTSIPGY